MGRLNVQGYLYSSAVSTGVLGSSVGGSLPAGKPWPHRLLSAVPDAHGAAALATEVREAFADSPTAPVNLAAACHAGRFRIRHRTLGSVVGGHEAMLLPQPRNAFQIWVDPTPSGGWQGRPLTALHETERHRTRFRVAHEIAHSFFFRREGGTPKRVVPDSPRQEAFCDAFAGGLLVPPVAASACAADPQEVIRLHNEYDVSLQVALRALCDAQPGLEAGILYWSDDSRRERRLGVQWTNAPESCAVVARSATHATEEGWRLARIPERRQLLWVAA